MKLNTRKRKKLIKKIENKIHYIYKSGKATFQSMMNFNSGLSDEDHQKFVYSYIGNIFMSYFGNRQSEYPIAADLYITWIEEKQTHVFKVKEKTEESIFMDDLSCMEGIQPHYQNN
jgi:hypothetical protein